MSINKRVIEKIEQRKIYRDKTAEEVFKELNTSINGLSSEEAQKRLDLYGYNTIRSRKKTDSLTLLLNQFKSPLIIILFFASILSYVLGESTDGTIIISILILSCLLGFKQERSATNAVEKLLSLTEIKSTVLRDGVVKVIPEPEIVVGDIIVMSAGNGIPADCLVLESKDLFINEATLTGETFPVEKRAGVVDKDAPINKRTNILYMGTSVVSGSGKAVVVRTGKETEFGKIAEKLRLAPLETEFEQGIRRFGNFLVIITLLLVVAIFFFSITLYHDIFDSFLFSVSLAVGITPELLPAIITITLSNGAKDMYTKKVIVKKLNAIENFGSMNVFCSDKTGTLTEGNVQIKDYVNYDGVTTEKVLNYAYINSYHQKGYENPIDTAVLGHKKFDVSGFKKLDEIPYDFIRKRLSILVSIENTRDTLLITKGAFNKVLEVCSTVENHDGKIVNINDFSTEIKNKYDEYGKNGFRVLGLAYKKFTDIQIITIDHEKDMTFLGFLILYDPLKKDIKETIKRMNDYGIILKVITGDNELVARNIGTQLEMVNSDVLTGPRIRNLSDEALMKLVNDIDIFAEVEPNQKERIIIALKKSGNVVGYIGDGINDATALHAADVGISVDNATDVAKDASQIVLMERNLEVLVDGVIAGRTTFANTMKYIFITTSANFGNMFSMAGSSLFLPFLPLLPKQVLLTNFITDFPTIYLSQDKVDEDWIKKPRRLNVKLVRRFMLVFGITSSAFDYIVFIVLILSVGTTPDEFRTTWFLESILTELFIIFVMRTEKLLFKSKPEKKMTIAIIVVSILIFIFPYSPLNTILGFVPLPPHLVLIIFIITASYIFTSELVKRFFYRKVKF